MSQEAPQAAHGPVENRPTPAMVLKWLRQAEDREKRRPDNPVDVAAVARYGRPIGSVIESHRSLPRAMDRARELIAAAALAGRSIASGTTILADTMSHCKGRFTRQWHAPAGGAWGCLIHANTLLPQSRRFLPLATGLACCELVRELGVSRATLRWVNDVLIDGRKLAGFLLESHTEPRYGEEFTLIGFGININNCQFPPELTASTCALRQVVGGRLDLSEITARFLARLAWNIGLLYHEEARQLQGQDFSGRGGRHLLLENWLGCSDSLGRRVVYGFDVVKDPQYRAKVLAVDEDGGLEMLLDGGQRKTEYSGEIRYLPDQPEA